MDKSQATKIWTMLTQKKVMKKYSGRVENEGTSSPQGFEWLDGMESVGIVSMTRQGKTMYFALSMVKGRKPYGYYLVLYRTNKSKTVLEIHQCLGATLVWNYSPRKQGGRNTERIELLKKLFGNTQFDIPKDDPTASRFVEDIFRLVEAKGRADALDTTLDV
jgi:hypothetical protein